MVAGARNHSKSAFALEDLISNVPTIDAAPQPRLDHPWDKTYVPELGRERQVPIHTRHF